MFFFESILSFFKGKKRKFCFFNVILISFAILLEGFAKKIRSQYLFKKTLVPTYMITFSLDQTLNTTNAFHYIF